MTNGETRLRELVQRLDTIAAEIYKEGYEHTAGGSARGAQLNMLATEFAEALAATVQAKAVKDAQTGARDEMADHLAPSSGRRKSEQDAGASPASPALSIPESVQAEVGAGEPCIHVNLIKQVGTMDGGVESTRYRCKGCSLFFVIKPHEITVVAGGAAPTDEELRKIVNAIGDNWHNNLTNIQVYALADKYIRPLLAARREPVEGRLREALEKVAQYGRELERNSNASFDRGFASGVRYSVDEARAALAGPSHTPSGGQQSD